jgi:ribonuclease P protein component
MKRRNRLSRSRDFDAVYRKGRSVSTRYLVLYGFPRADEVEEESRLGLAVSRKVGGAVERNRVKRRLRAAFEQLEESVPPGRDFVLIVRPGFAEAAEANGFEWLGDRVSEIFQLAGGTERGART